MSGISPAGRGASSGPAPAAAPAGAGGAQDLQVQLGRLRLGLRAQLAPERVDAHLILPERRGAPAVLGVQAHQRPVHGLLRGIQGDHVRGRPGRRLVLAVAEMMGEEPGRALDGHLEDAQALIA